MKLENNITIYTTEDAKRKEKKPKQKQKTKCPSCEIKHLKEFNDNIITEDMLKGDE
jgi:hypothetical protein